MKLNFFSSETFPNYKRENSSPKVSFGKSGVISFNDAACTLIGIAEKSKITLAQDEEDAANWYFFIDEEHGYPLRIGYDKKGVIFNHVGMIRAFYGAFGLDIQTRQFLIAGQHTIIKGSKTKYWGIIVIPK